MATSEALTTYTIQVQTSDVGDAGTNSNVSIKLVGDKGETKKFALDNSNNNFERGDLDIFNVSDTDVGPLKSITIWHDGAGIASGWHLAWVKVSSPGQPEAAFAHNGWIDNQSVTLNPA